MKIHCDQGPIVIDFDTDCIAGKVVGQNLWVLPDGTARLNELKFTQDVMLHPYITNAGHGTLVMDGGPRGCKFDALIMQFVDGSCVYLVKCDAHNHAVAVVGSLGRLDKIGSIPLKATYAPTNGTHLDVPHEIREVVKALEADFIQKLGPDAINFNDGLGTLTDDVRNGTLPDWVNASDEAWLKAILVKPN